MKFKKGLSALIIVSILGALGTGCSKSNVQTQKKDDRKLADIVGVTHTSGKYNFSSNEDFLNEGADQILSLGTRVIKVFMTPQYKTRDYVFNSNWPDVSSLKELAETDYFKTLFNKPFTTYVIETIEIPKKGSIEEVNYLDGLSPEEAAITKKQLYDLTKYLMTTYQGTGKTFVLQNWESDSVLKDPRGNPLSSVYKGMIDWLNAREDGINEARNELKDIKGVTVLGAAEVNKLPLGPNATPDPSAAVENIIPYTHMDLYSYSDWETGPYSVNIKYALDYLAKKAPVDKKFGFGDKNIYLGEYGVSDSQAGGDEKQMQQVKAETEAALDWGVRYTLYWELYCNEPVTTGFTGKPANNDLKGYWLIRPDGTKTKTWEYFQELLKNK